MGKKILGLKLPGPCDIALGCCEATIYYKGEMFASLPGVYQDMTAVSPDGEIIATFGGSDECGGKVSNVISYTIENGNITAVVNFKKVK